MRLDLAAENFGSDQAVAIFNNRRTNGIEPDCFAATGSETSARALSRIRAGAREAAEKYFNVGGTRRRFHTGGSEHGVEFRRAAHHAWTTGASERNCGILLHVGGELRTAIAKLKRRVM